MKPRSTFWAFLIILLISLFGIIFTQSKIYYRVAYLSLLIILLSYVWTLFSIKGIEVSRYVRLNRLKVGEVLLEQFIIKNQFNVVKVWLEIKDECKIYGKTGSKVLSWIGAKQKRTYVAHSRLYQRGQFLLGPTMISSGDPLGLYINSHTIHSDQSIVVLPFTVHIKHFPSPTGQLAGARVPGRRTNEVTPQAYGVHDYSPGDPLNRIHWLSSLRHNRLMVKEFEQDPRADVWLFLDAAKDIHARTIRNVISAEEGPIWKHQPISRFNLPEDSFEYAITIAGSIADYFIGLGRSVGFLCSGQTNILISPEMGERQRNHILETLAFIRDEGNLPLIALINSQAENISSGSTVVIVTSSKCPHLELINQVIILRRLNPVIVILDALSFDFQQIPRIKIEEIMMYDKPVVIIKYNDDIGLKLEKGFNTLLAAYSF